MPLIPNDVPVQTLSTEITLMPYWRTSHQGVEPHKYALPADRRLC